ncbi:MAG: peptide chain release factor 1 [Kiritimatiellia bacterium]
MIDAAYLEKLNARLHELETQMGTPQIANDQSKMRGILTEHKQTKTLRDIGKTYVDLVQQLTEIREMLEDASLGEEMREMAEMELEELEARLPDAEKTVKVALLDPDPTDDRNSILEIRAGTGGDEAALFAGDLFRMYQRYAETKGWNCKILDASESEMGGYKEIIASIEGPEIYKYMKYESGVHRVQRVPATEAAGRIHTSAATVAILPEAEEMDEIQIPQEDIRVDVFRSSGPGGQSVNTTDSAIRITHLPTGLIVQCQDEKSQHRNREKALLVLQARLFDRQRQEEEAKRAGDRKTMIGTGDRSERIRTYNFPQNRLTDHRIGLTIYHLDRIIEGDLDELLIPLYEHDIEERLKVEMDSMG